MQKQYNHNLRFNDYKTGEKVWLKVKHYKTGENRKLAPRRNGAWTVLERLPNGVNFKIINDNSNEDKVVHHDRLIPIKGDISERDTASAGASKPSPVTKVLNDNECTESGGSSDDTTEINEYEPNSSEDSASDADTENDRDIERYPR